MKTTVSLAGLLLASAAGAAPLAPPAPRGIPLEYEGALRAFARSGPWEPMGELSGRLQFEGRKPARDLMLGSYYRAAAPLKVGAFLRLSGGARHDDDWISPRKGTWVWRDTTDRTEPVLVLDATPRALLTRLPGRNWLGAVKTRFEHNLSDGQEVFWLQPELSWFMMEGLTPRLHAALRYEAGLSLNFGERTLGEQWVYASGLWHCRGGLVVGPHVALGERWFSTSRAFADAGGGSYRVRWKSLKLGLDAVWRFGG